MRRSKSEPMDPKFQALAVYNGERARGIVHSLEWNLQMRRLQAEFNKQAR